MNSQLAHQLSREKPRYKTKSGLLVVRTQDNEIPPYHVIDISTGGFSFRYLGKKLPSSEFEQVSLYYENKLILDSIWVKPVSDDLLRDNLVPVRRRSVRFDLLSSEQEKKLESFIRQYTEISD